MALQLLTEEQLFADDSFFKPFMDYMSLSGVETTASFFSDEELDLTRHKQFSKQARQRRVSSSPM